jgi:arylsulfatase A-like enzyme
VVFNMNIRIKSIQLLLLSLSIFTFFLSVNARPHTDDKFLPKETKRLNILLVVADDLGLFDLGYMGSEVNTPNLDILANTGTILSDFYTAPTCSPTRAMLLSGTDNHIAGLGDMAETSSAETKKNPGYEGYLNHQVTSIATRLVNNGYHTYMSGKWHLGFQKGQRPAQRGFEKSFALLDGAAGHFAQSKAIFPTHKPKYVENDLPVVLPDNFYSTISYTDKLLNYLTIEHKNTKPFFAYLSYTAPHWPLQVPDNALDLYQGQYDSGYDIVRQKRISAAKNKGYIIKSVTVNKQEDKHSSWQSLTKDQQKYSSRQMEIYAAMVDIMDQQIGRVIRHLKDTNQFDNTVIIFMSDNGPAGGNVTNKMRINKWVDDNFDKSYQKIGTVDAWDFYDRGWAAVSAGINRHHKGNVYQGGIHSPAFIVLPKNQSKVRKLDQMTHVKDFYSTILDLTRTSLTEEEHSQLQSRSLLPLLIQEDLTQVDVVQGWEFRGNKALRHGNWKLVKSKNQVWQLYDLLSDPSETHDVSKSNPKKVELLLEHWNEYKNKNGVLSGN